MRYNNYHKHDHVSNIFSPDTNTKAEEYILKSLEYGHINYFTTNHGSFGDIFEARTLCNKYGLRCIAGIEGYIVPNAYEKDKRNYHIIVIPKTDKARKKMNYVSSMANIKGFYYKPRFFIDDLLNLDSDDIFITTACVAGVLRDDDSIEKIFKPLYKHFGKNVMLEVQTHDDPMQIEVNKKAIDFADKYGLRLIAANDSHYIELLAACAALDFYHADMAHLKENKSAGETDYVYRAVDGSGKFEFKDFVGNQDNYDKDFAKKFGMLIAFSFLCNDPDIDFVESVRCNKQKEITGFDGIDVNQVEYLKKYFRLFNVRNVNGELAEGWIRQIHRSANGGDNFLFNPKLFAFHTMKELRKYDWNKSLYRNEGVGKDWTFSVGIFGSKFDTFKKKFIEELHNGAPTTITNTGERFYKLIYETLCKIYNIN